MRWLFLIVRIALAGGGLMPNTGHAETPLRAAPIAPPEAVPTAVRAVAARPNVFASRVYFPTPLPTFQTSRTKLPEPVLADHPEWVRLYWKAWDLAFSHLKQPSAASGFVSNFIDPAFKNLNRQ